MSNPAVHKRRIVIFAACFIAIVAAALLVLSPTQRAVNSPALSSQRQSSQTQSAKTVTPAANNRLQATFAALPLAFEQNQGQTDPQVKYMARGNGYKLFLTNHDAVFAIHPKSSGSGLAASRRSHGHASAKLDPKPDSVVRMQLVGANLWAAIAATDELPGKTNYYLGNDPKKWQTNVPQFSRVAYKNVYPGIDLAYYGQQSKLEFDFIVAPESSPTPIDLSFSGAQHLTTDASGNLIVSSTAGDVILHKPVAYQLQNGIRQPVAAAFALKAGNQISFDLGSYDHDRDLVIDPSLTYATYLGGAQEDEVFAIAVDSSNNIYVTGESNSTSGWPGPNNVPSGNSFDVFVTKLTSAGVMSYTTFVGGSNADSGLAIAVDSIGEAYVTGITQSGNFPVTSGAAQTSTTNTAPCTNIKNSSGSSPCSDAFALKLTASGAKSWATYVGGNNDDDGYAIALDSSGNVWVAGDTFSSTFYPLVHATITLNTTFNNSGTLNPPADDGFVVELNPAGTSFLYATYLGGSFGDQINAIAMDATDNVYVTGETNSSDFPTAGNPYQPKCGSDGSCNLDTSTGAAYYDAFVTKIATGGTSLTYSTFVGGSSDDYAYGLAVDSAGNSYLTGYTSSDDTTTTPAVPYPTTTGAFSTTYTAGTGGSNGFVTELNSSGSALVYSTFLGGSVADFGGGIALDSLGDAYVTGVTQSANFPVTSNAIQSQLNGNGSTSNTDAFITQVLPGGATLGFSTYLGGSGDENDNTSGSVGTIALDSTRNIWVAGSTNSTNFPATSTAAQSTLGGNPYDGFVAEISSAAVSDFNIAATTPTAVSPGTSATSTVTLTSLFGYGNSVTLGCAVTGTGSPLPACSASSFSVGSVTPTTSGAMSTLTITTTGASAAMSRPSEFFYAMWLPIAGMALVGAGFSSARTRRKKLLGFLLIGMVVSALFLMPACGGGSSSSGGGGGGGGGCAGCTSAGNYTVTITGTDANNLSHSYNVTLTVN